MGGTFRTAVALTALLVCASTAHATDGWPDLSKPAGSSRQGAKDAALVIAIEDYAFAQDIPGAVSNGKAWVSWLKDGHGVPLVKPLFNQQATNDAMLAEVSRVAKRVEPGGRLWLVYIGHGAPSESGDDGVLVGVDAQQTPASLEARGLKRAELLAAAESALPAGTEVILVQDACFSGKTSRGDLAPGMAPLKTVSARLGPKVTVLSAARSDEYAGPLSDGKRPAFSYLVLGALRGWGDRNRDGEISAAEAVSYADDALVQTTTGRSQTPELAGPDLTLGLSGKERSPDLTALAMAATATSPTPVEAAGHVAVEFGGEAIDYASIAAEAAAADRAAAEAALQQARAQRRLEEERRKRLDAAADEARASAARDFRAIEPLLTNPSANSRRVLETWLAQYGSVVVTIDGIREEVEVPQVARVVAALEDMRREERRQPDPAPGAATAAHRQQPTQPIPQCVPPGRTDLPAGSLYSELRAAEEWSDLAVDQWRRRARHPNLSASDRAAAGVQLGDALWDQSFLARYRGHRTTAINNLEAAIEAWEGARSLGTLADDDDASLELLVGSCRELVVNFGEIAGATNDGLDERQPGSSTAETPCDVLHNLINSGVMPSMALRLAARAGTRVTSEADESCVRALGYSTADIEKLR